MHCRKMLSAIALCFFAINGCTEEQFEDTAEDVSVADTEDTVETNDIQESESVNSETSSRNIFGMDNRDYVDESPDRALRKLAKDSTAMLTMGDWVDDSNPNDVTFTDLGAQNLIQRYDLCSDQTFAFEKSAGVCTGTLIGEDIMLSAAHCFPLGHCDGRAVVFNYINYSDGSNYPITTQDVFECTEMLLWRDEGGFQDDQSYDYAVFRLDRKATPRFTPALVTRDDTALTVRNRLGVIGSPLGVPLKIDNGGRVRDLRTPQSGYFKATADTFKGNSGGPVYDLNTYRVAGIVVRGEDDNDLKYNTADGCNRYGVYDEWSKESKELSYVGAVMDEFCASYGSEPVCNRGNTFSFSTSQTSSANRDTRDQYIYLKAGQNLKFGTRSLEGAGGTGDTYLRLMDADGNEVARNDDSGGTRLSLVSYNAAGDGLYEMRAGCYSSYTCSGTVAFEVQGSDGGLVHYHGENTNSALQNTQDVTIILSPGDRLEAGTIHLNGALASADTYLRLYKGTSQVAYNDDAYGTRASFMSYEATQTGTYTLKAGCWSSSSCGGVVAYNVFKSATWTEWFDRDDPSGSGDGEWLSLFVDEAWNTCERPIDVQCRRVSDKVDWTQTGENVTCDKDIGAACINYQGGNGYCDDYEVRFLCPDLSDGYWTPFLNRDDPSTGDGKDDETFQQHYADGNVCARPIAVEGRVASGGNWWEPKQNTTCTVEDGLFCPNVVGCYDYKVRFYCLNP